MKIHHISDSHGMHELLKIDKTCDMIIFSGDESNPWNKFQNKPECLQFIEWFGNLNIKYKIMIAGNHSAYIYHNTKDFKELCDSKGIIYLENESIEIEGIKIWGSPLTPTFGNWWYMKERGKLDNIWKHIPDDTDIVIVHGPPKGILDVSYKRDGAIENCGCNALKRHILKRIKPKFCLFGHIHNNEDIINAGVCKLSAYDTIFSNGSVVTDGKFGKVSSNGNILIYE